MTKESYRRSPVYAARGKPVTLHEVIAKRHIAIGAEAVGILTTSPEHKSSELYRPVRGIITYIHPEGHYAIIKTPHFQTAFHPMSIYVQKPRTEKKG